MAPAYGAVVGLIIISPLGPTAVITYVAIAAPLLFINEWRRR